MSFILNFGNFIEKKKKIWYPIVFSLYTIVSVTFFLLLFYVFPRNIEKRYYNDISTIIASYISEFIICSGIILFIELENHKDPENKKINFIGILNFFFLHLILKYFLCVGSIYAKNYVFSIIVEWLTTILIILSLITYFIVYFIRKIKKSYKENKVEMI